MSKNWGRTGNKSQSTSQVIRIIFRKNFETGEITLPKLPETGDKERWMDTWVRSKAGGIDQPPWEELENNWSQLWGKDPKSNKESIFREAQKISREENSK